MQRPCYVWSTDTNKYLYYSLWPLLMADVGNTCENIFLNCFLFNIFNIFRPWVSESVDINPMDEGILLYICYKLSWTDSLKQY